MEITREPSRSILASWLIVAMITAALTGVSTYQSLARYQQFRSGWAAFSVPIDFNKEYGIIPQAYRVRVRARAGLRVPVDHQFVGR